MPDKIEAPKATLENMGIGGDGFAVLLVKDLVEIRENTSNVQNKGKVKETLPVVQK